MENNMTNREKFDILLDRYFNDYMLKGDPFDKGTFIPFSMRCANSAVVGDGTITMAELLTVLIMMERTNRYYDNKYNVTFHDVIMSLERLFESAREWGETLCPLRFNANQADGFFVRDDIDSENELLKEKGITDLKSNWMMIKSLKNEDPCHSPFVSQDQVWNLSAPLMYLFMETDNDFMYEKIRRVAYKMNEFIKMNGYTVYNPYLSLMKHYFEYCPPFSTEYWLRQDLREDKFKMSVKVKRGANNWYYSGGTKHCCDVFCEDSNGLQGLSFRAFVQSLVFLFLDGVWDNILRMFGDSFKLNPVYCYGYVGCWFGSNRLKSRENFEKRLVKKFNKLIKKGEPFEWNVLALLSEEALMGIDFDSLDKWLNDYKLLDHTKTSVYAPTDFLTLYMIREMKDWNMIGEIRDFS